METIQIFGLMAFLGLWVFIGSGFCLTFSIEAKNNKIVEEIFTYATLLGLLLTIIGLIGLGYMSYK